MNISLIDYSSSKSSFTSDIDEKDDINNNTRRICDGNDRTLLDLIKLDDYTRCFLILSGYYIHGVNDSFIVKFLARLWQICLLLFGGIGFIWQVFIIGSHYWLNLYDLINSSNPNTLEVFLHCGELLITFIVPCLQVFSLIYGVYSIYTHKQMHQTINAEIALPLLQSCKRNALIFFIFMILLVISIDPIAMSRNFYTDIQADFDDKFLHQAGAYTYSLYAFNIFTSGLFFNLSLACYLSVMVFFISLVLKQINALQENIIKMIDNNTFTLTKYLDAKDNIITLRNGTYFSTELLTITAAINVIAFMFQLWSIHHYYLTKNITYKEMIFYSFTLFPFLLKGNYHY